MGIIRFVYRYYDSLLLILVSSWLALTLIKVGHAGIANIMIALVLIKTAGMIADKGLLRKIGVVGLNGMWAMYVYVFMSGSHAPVALTFQFPLVIFLLGLGIALRGHFSE